MSRRSKPKHLSELDVQRVLREARQLMDSINGMSISTDSDHYRAMRRIVDVLVDEAKVIVGHDRPWPLHMTSGTF